MCVSSQNTTLAGKAGLISQSAAQELVGKKKPFGPAAAIPSEGRARALFCTSIVIIFFSSLFLQWTPGILFKA